MKRKILSALVAMTPVPAVLAATTYDPATNIATISSIVVGATEYTDVKFTPDVASVKINQPAGSAESYDPAKNEVTLPSVTVGSDTYTGIVVKVGQLISIGGQKPATSTTETPVTPNDPLFPDQWHLKNTGQAGPNGSRGTPGEDINATPAWNLATGKGVQIAVIDDGLDINHEDLSIVAGKSWDYRTNAYGDPSSSASSHGTSCGGLAAATGNNSIGVTGVAYNAKLVGYNLLSATTGDYGADSVTKDLASNHVYSNSYGATDGLGTLQPSDAAWRAAIETGITTGRDGKGAVYVWAAGNGAPTDRSDYDGQGNYHGVLTVGSLNDQGKKSSYSEPGSNVLVMAFGGEQCATHTTTTVDVSGTPGYNNGTSSTDDYSGQPNYTRCMNGTSAATPEVTGVVALMLEANPALGWRDVRLILAKTARQNDPSDADWITNGGGLKINHNYGYGTVDASAAVKAAKTWTNVAAQKTATSSATSNEISLSSTGITKLEFVELTVASDHAEVGDLTITLTSPSNTVSTLAKSHDCMQNESAVPCGATLASGFRFGVVRLIGEVADGKWVLTATNSKTGSPVTIKSWDIKVMGY